MVCIDDFAIRKGVKYATVMIDINSHKIIDMINSRDYEEVTSWLKEFPNLKIVSRDCSLTYKKAIMLRTRMLFKLQIDFIYLKI